MRNQTIEVSIGPTINVKRVLANIIDSLIIERDNNISVFEEGVLAWLESILN